MSKPITGQVVLSGTPQQLSTLQGFAAVISIKASPNNAHSAYIGPSGVTLTSGYELAPGETMEYEGKSSNLGLPGLEISPSDLYVVGTNPDVVSWFVSP